MAGAADMLESLIDGFAIYGDFAGAEPFGTGHINSTFVSRWSQGGLQVRYLHQRINSGVFRRPDQVMENIIRVTGHIAGRVPPGERSRRTLTVVPAKSGESFLRDREGGCWRTYLFIEGIKSLSVVSSPAAASFLGKSIGNFQKQLADLPAPRLHDAIPDFHNMEFRYRNFYSALERDPENRAKTVKAEIGFMRENEERGCVLSRSLGKKILPERICHNDAKMDNILIDRETEEALCVSDLDTVMPGTALFDSGDLIRTVTTTAAEDETDLSKVTWSAEYCRALLSGYLSEAADFFVPAEYDLLAESGRALTQIMAIRFLTDYIEGDVYYHIDRPDHNIDRCRNQLALIRSMDAQWKTLETIVGDLRGQYGRT